MIYVDYKKGSEDGLNIRTLARVKPIGEFPIHDLSYTNPIQPITQSGRYRIPIPLSTIENGVIVKAELAGDTSSAGNASIYLDVGE